jgi:hypothetical protein
MLLHGQEAVGQLFLNMLLLLLGPVVLFVVFKVFTPTTRTAWMTFSVAGVAAQGVVLFRLWYLERYRLQSPGADYGHSWWDEMWYGGASSIARNLPFSRFSGLVCWVVLWAILMAAREIVRRREAVSIK